ncbi:MAG: accessory gene regulator B family protein [Oscillospiraceae bacterium]|nr:accessory gene regulator B family protein [Oscillospiraceae bacterium]
MTEKIAKRVSLYLVGAGIAQEKDRLMLEYGLFHTLSSFLHILYLFLVGFWFSVLLEIAVFSLFFCSLKGQIGGAHATGHWQCLLTFTGAALGGALLGKTLSPLPCSLAIMLFLSGASFVLVFLRAPTVHPNNPVHKKAALAKFRKKAVLTSGIQFVCAACLSFFASLSPYLICGSLGSAAAAVTLLLPIPNPNGKEGET